jgi:hypothetical protein
MGQSIPQQHPAVVLRSHYRHLKALLAVAMIAVAVLAATVVLLATDSDGPARAGSNQASPAAGNVESMSSQSAARRSAVHGKGSPIIHTAGHRYDGGPSEGTVGLGH